MKKIELTVAERIVITEKGLEFFNKYQKLHSQQNTATPVDVVVDIVNNLDVTGKSVAVVANFDVFIYMQYLNQKFDLGITDLKLITDVKLNFTSDKIIYVDSFKEIKLNKKFDVAILNPPYTDGKNTQLGMQITKLINKYADSLAVILPYNQAKSLSKNNPGHLFSTDVTKSFNVDLAAGIFVSYYDCTSNIINTLDDISNTFTKYPKQNNLASLMYSQCNRSQICIDDEIINPVTIQLTATQQITISSNEYERLRHLELGAGKWKVMLSLVGGKVGKGISTLPKIVIGTPDTKALGNIIVFPVNTEKQAELLSAYLKSDIVTNIISFVKTSSFNKKEIFEYIPMPDFLK
jgi:hypothetical protein